VSTAKTAEPMEMPFGKKTRVGARNPVSEKRQDPPQEGALLREVGAIGKHYIFIFIHHNGRNTNKQEEKNSLTKQKKKKKVNNVPIHWPKSTHQHVH